MSQTSESARRRRGSAFVTKNACTGCKKKRSKCDGQQPCARCAAVEGEICHYGVPSRVTKENMRAEIEELRRYRQMSEFVLSSMGSEEQSIFIQQQLRDGVELKDIYQLSKPEVAATFSQSGLVESATATDSGRSEQYSAMSSGWGGKSDVGSDVGDSLGNSHEIDGTAEQEVGDGDGHSSRLENSAGVHMEEPWTTVTTDDAFIEHLLSLYFCWEYPIFASLCRQHFLEDFRIGRRRYCSSLLVNAVLAVGCLFSTDPSKASSVDDSNSWAQRFFNEAKRLWAGGQDDATMTTVQALGLLSIYEASRGRDSHGKFFSGQSIRTAVELGLHRSSDDTEISATEREVRSATIWGAFGLDNAWSLTIGHVPHLSRLGVSTAKPVMLEFEEHTEWKPYTGDGTLVASALTQTSNARSISIAMAALFEVVHRSLYVLYVPERLLSNEGLLDIYTRYLSWYDSLPTNLQLGGNSTPSVLFMHIYYQFAVLLLFGPFIKLRLLGSTISPYDTCVEAANTITALLRSYSQLYSLRRTPCFVPILALASGAMHIIYAQSADLDEQSAISQAIADLEGMAYTHRSAMRGAKILEAASQRGVYPDPLPGPEAGMEDSVDLNRHFKSSIQYLPAMVVNALPSSGSSVTQPIFIPFPSQVLPLTASEQQLTMRGFELLGQSPR